MTLGSQWMPAGITRSLLASLILFSLFYFKLIFCIFFFNISFTFSEFRIFQKEEPLYIEKEHFNVTLEGEPNPRFPSTENKILFLFFLLDLICRSENRGKFC